MLKFKTSRLNTLIGSLEDLKNAEKKLSQIKNKVFNNLYEWSLEETNNVAIQDITNKMSKLYSNLEGNLRQEKIESLNNFTQLFIKFKEYDSKIEKQIQITKNAQKSEKKCLNDIKKCPASKSIRDYEIRHQKAEQELEYSKFKFIELSKDIDATKSILFKTNLKRLNEMFLRENEADKVLLNAVNNLVEQIPDVSNEEVDDINSIQYTKHEETNKICNHANKKLTRLSSTQIKIEDFDQVYSNSIIIQENKQTNSLYPCLDNLKGLNDSLNQLGFTHSTHNTPPPTYSDSESYYNESNKNIVKPTAPSPPPSLQGNKHRSVSFNLNKNQVNECRLVNSHSSFNFE